jgi:ABC-type polysaccharide/polyol phosphate export permease
MLSRSVNVREGTRVSEPSGTPSMSSSIATEMPVDRDVDWPVPASNVARAWNDLVAGLGKSWLWMELAHQDIKLRYRGSMLGPFWLTISTAVMISSMGFLYAKLFHTDVATYLPFLTAGIIFWNLVASVITEGCGTFTAVQSIIQQVPLPFSVHAYRLVYRNIVVMLHSVVIIPVVNVIFHIGFDWRILWALPALAVIALNGVWISILFGMLSARFRDVPPIVGSFVQVIFFVTPVFWHPDTLGVWRPIGELNPLFAAIDVVRSPLLGAAPAPHSWPILLIVTIVGGFSTFLLFARFRSRIAFWV